MKYYNPIISILLHHLLLIIATAYFLVIIDPAHIGFDNILLIKNPKIPQRTMASIFLNLIILPSITMLLLWKLGFIKNFKIDSYKNRIIPLIAMMTFLFWSWFTLKNVDGINPLISHFLLGLFISVSIVFLVNPFFMISFHMLAAVQCFAILLQYTKITHYSFLPVLIIFAIIFTLLFIKKTTTKLENPLAIIIGILSQLFVSLL